jgi:hypothetical protein
VSILDALGRQQHLDDNALAEVWSARLTGDAATAYAADAHLEACVPCQARYDDLSTWLGDLRAEAVDEADELFPPDRLAAQQAQIFRRLEALERPARVIAFPRFSQPTAVVRRGPQRWIAAAAAAGLIVGLGAGELLDFRHSVHTDRQAAVETPVAQSARGGLQPVSFTFDDSLLYDNEAAITSPRVEALQALDALTPRVRDVDAER